MAASAEHLAIAVSDGGAFSKQRGAIHNARSRRPVRIVGRHSEDSMSFQYPAIVAGLMSLVVMSGVAVAEPLAPDELHVVKPTGTADKAVHKPGRIPWCTGKHTLDVWDKKWLRRAVSARFDTEGRWMEAVQHICQWADDPTWQQQATYMVQEMMNAKNLSQDEAVEEIKKWITGAVRAKAKEGRDPTDEERFEFAEHDLKPVAALPGVDTVKVTVPAWCDKAGPIKDKWNTGRISRTADGQYGITGTIEAAYHICQRPNDPTWKTKASLLLQKWMNWTKQTQANAEASLRARIQIDKAKTERDALCKELEISAEAGGRVRAYGLAQRRFFGCHDKDGAELWREGGINMGDAVGFYYDADSDTLESEIVRLYWLFSVTTDPADELPSKDPSENAAMLDYAVASHDFAKIDDAAIDKQLRAAPFAANDFARAVVHESLAVLKWRRKMFEHAIDKLTKGDADYQAIFREAPKKGYAEWEKLTGPWKAELARAAAFERKLSEPSRKALVGCAADMQKDAQKLITSYKSSVYSELLTKIASDPVASLLLSRLAVCYAAEKLPGSGVLADLVKKGRDMRGPRSLAYYTIVDKIVETLKDRPRMVVSLANFNYDMTNLVNIYAGQFAFIGGVNAEPEKTGIAGVVKEVKKGPKGVQVVFKTVKFKYPDVDCTPTNRPIRIHHDGRIEYAQNCRENGKMIVEDNTPRPIVVPPMYAAGLKPGLYVVASAADDDQTIVVYTKKTADDKKIQTFFGFTL
jgi:hypothetical protein